MTTRMLLTLVAIATIGGCSTSGGPVGTGSTIAEGVSMRLTSTAFIDGGPIPTRYTCDGDDVSPPLEIGDIPFGTVALVVVMDDPDAPRGTWDHWVAFDVPVTGVIPEDVGTLGVSGDNSWGNPGYGGPCPPSGEHRYVFRVFALSEEVGLPSGATKADVLDAMGGTVLGSAALTGTYSR